MSIQICSRAFDYLPSLGEVDWGYTSRHATWAMQKSCTWGTSSPQKGDPRMPRKWGTLDTHQCEKRWGNFLDIASYYTRPLLDKMFHFFGPLPADRPFRYQWRCVGARTAPPCSICRSNFHCRQRIGMGSPILRQYGQPSVFVHTSTYYCLYRCYLIVRWCKDTGWPSAEDKRYKFYLWRGSSEATTLSCRMKSCIHDHRGSWGLSYHSQRRHCFGIVILLTHT